MQRIGVGFESVPLKPRLWIKVGVIFYYFITYYYLIRTQLTKGQTADSSRRCRRIRYRESELHSAGINN